MAAAAEDVLFSGLGALASGLREGALSPVDLVEVSLARAEADRLGAFVAVTADRAREEGRTAAAEIAQGRWRGPLHGIPFGLVDALDTRGVATTFGAAPLRDRVPARDATIAARLAEAGAILVGKLSTIELGGALGCTSASAALSGPCRTPWDPERWAGISSGPAAAVAAGIVPFAMGADTVGAIGCAAAYCGATGLRPSYGVLSRHGLLPAAYTLDAPGPLARSAADCATVLAILAGADPKDPSSLPAPPGLDRVRPEIPRGLRVALLPPPDEGVPGAARDALVAAADVFRGAGALVSEAPLPALPYDDVARVILEAEAANAFEELVRSGRTRSLADPLHRARAPADYVPRATSADYVRAMRLRAEVQRVLARFFERHDLVLAANRPAGPPRLDAPLGPLLATLDPLGAAASLAGLPTVALPAGFAGRLPLSVQLAAPPLEEARLLSAAALFQSRTSHHLARPEAAPAVAAR